MSTGNNPLLKERVSISDIESGLRNVRSETERVLDAIEDHKRKSSGDSEMQFLMKMSSLELQMTNICTEFRASFL